jgi:hypothetical protein
MAGLAERILNEIIKTTGDLLPCNLSEQYSPLIYNSLLGRTHPQYSTSLEIINQFCTGF